MAAEQVLYSWMTINGTESHAMVGALPCSWNMQVGSWHSRVSWTDADAPRRRCSSGCHMVHGPGAEGKAVLGLLRAMPNCSNAFDAARRRPHYPRGSASEALLLRAQRACCAAGGRGALR